MRRSWMIGVAAALAIVVMPAAGAAQVPSDKGRASHAMKGKDWEQRRERIRAAFLDRLGEEIQLDSATREEMTQSFDRFRDQFRSLYKERRAVSEKLRAAVDRDAPEAELKAILSEYDSVRDRSHRIMADRGAEVRQILGTRRYAKYVLFRKQFHRDIRKKLHERRRK